MAFLWLILAAVAFLIVKAIDTYKNNSQNKADVASGKWRGIDPQKEFEYQEEERILLAMHLDKHAYGDSSRDRELPNSPLRMYLEKHPERIDEYIKSVAAERMWEEGYRSYYMPSPDFNNFRPIAMRWFMMKVDEEFPCKYDLSGIFAPDDDESYQFYGGYDYDANIVFDREMDSAWERWERREGEWIQPSLLRTFFEDFSDEDLSDATGEKDYAGAYVWLSVCINMWLKWSDISSRRRTSRKVFLDRIANDSWVCLANYVKSSPELYTCPEKEMLSHIRHSGSDWDAAVKKWESVGKM